MKDIIREKSFEDCVSCERVYTLSWQQTYKGIINDEFLNNLTNNEIDRIKRNQDNFYNDNDKRFVLEVDNKIVGVLSIGKSRNDKYSECGELKSVYILNDYKGKGYGKKLFIKAVEELVKLGYKDMIIACLQGNPSNDFYKYMGGKFVDTSSFVLPNQELIENVYYYSNISELLN